MKHQVEFKPPSDFVADDSGGGNNVWKYLGIGCGVVLLIIGIAFAFGAWKTASCCGDVVDAGKYTAAASQTATQFAANVSSGKVDEAYSQTSESFQERVTKEQFRKRLAQHARFLQASAPRQSGMETDTGQDPQNTELKPSEWTISFEFAGPDSTEKLAMTLGVVRKGEGDDAEIAVDSMRFDVRERVLAAEPPAQTVTDFHRKVQRGSYDLAYKLMASEYSTKNDRSAFDGFLDENQSAFLGSTPTIKSVDYGSGRATVVAETSSQKGEKWRISYELTRGFSTTGWSITSIEPTQIEAGGDRGTEDEAVDDSGEEEGADQVDEPSADESETEGNGDDGTETQGD